jgi:SAM-dependent methyltransferase
METDTQHTGSGPTDRTRHLGLRLVSAFVVGFVGLSLEIAYTRVISFKIFYYYTYFVIGLALLGLGAASSAIALSSRLRRLDTLDLVRKAAPIAGLVGAITYVAVARLETDVNLIWVGSKGQALSQLVRLLILSISLTAVFFGVGLILARLIVAEAQEVRRLYFWDLTGAAVGCLAAVPLQLTIGPPAMILWSSVLLVLLGLGITARLGVRFSPQSVALAAIVVIATVGAGTFEVRMDTTKTLRDSDDVVGGDWGAVFRVDAVEFGPLHVLHHDGLWGSSIWRYDGTPETTARFDNDSRQLPFAALGRDPERILIIGAAGGNEIQAALTYGVGQIDAVELNPVTVDLLEGKFADYSGNLTTRDNVNYVQGDGRTFLARSDEQYDMIWFVAPDTYAASNSATSGAFVLSESYLYTKEMISEAYDHLSPSGMVVSQFGDFDFDARPTRTARYLVTAREALDGHQTDFADQTALIVNRGGNDLDRFSTMLLFKTPPDQAVSERLRSTLDIVPGTEALHLPDGSLPGSGITTDIITGTPDDVSRIVDDYSFDISSIDDNRPFFWHFTPFGDIAGDWSRSYEDSEIAIGERLLIVLILVAIVVAAAFLWLPFVLTRRRNEPVAAVTGRGRMFAYFAAIGLGFMFIEISMIQRFSLLLGYPTLSLSVSLFTLLLATAIGARFSGRIGARPSVGLPAAVVALVVITLLYLVISDPVTDIALAWSEPFRIALVFLMLLPVGIALGMFLPAGIDRATQLTSMSSESDRGRFVAWCWAVNGFFSVIGSSVTTVSSMSFGFDRTVIIGLVLYLIALVAMLTGRSHHEASAVDDDGRHRTQSADADPLPAQIPVPAT